MPRRRRGPDLSCIGVGSRRAAAVRSRAASSLPEVPGRRGRTRAAARRLAPLRFDSEHPGLAGPSRYPAALSLPHEQPRPAAAPELLGRGHPLRDHRGRLRRLVRPRKLFGRALRLHGAARLPAQPGRRVHRPEFRHGRLRAGAVLLHLQELRCEGSARLRVVRLLRRQRLARPPPQWAVRSRRRRTPAAARSARLGLVGAVRLEAASDVPCARRDWPPRALPLERRCGTASQPRRMVLRAAHPHPADNSAWPAVWRCSRN